MLGFCHNVPDLSIKGLLSKVHAVVDGEQYELIRGKDIYLRLLGLEWIVATLWEIFNVIDPSIKGLHPSSSGW